MSENVMPSDRKKDSEIESAGSLKKGGYDPAADPYYSQIHILAQDPAKLEQLYRGAIKAGDGAAFSQAIKASRSAAPQNLLYEAWYHRLEATVAETKKMVIAWSWVIPLALLNGLLFWWLSDDNRFMLEIISPRTGFARDWLPTFFILAAPVSATVVLIYLTAVSRKRWQDSGLIALLLLAAAGYVIWTYPQLVNRNFQEQYLNLMILHLPLTAWAGVGVFLIREHRDPASRFAFLIKSLDVLIMGGLFVAAGGLFTGISFGLFQALDIEFPEVVMRLFIAGGGGLIPVIAVAVMYNPTLPPAEQAFDEGLNKLIALLMRFLIPLTLIVLVVYLAFIPFNFREPFDNRDVLIIYNGMLFAVVALLASATPVSRADLAPRLAIWLRRGIIAVAFLTLIVSVYALAAIIYRTVLDRLTPNRLAFIGWNLLNMGLLSLLLVYQLRGEARRWLEGLQRAFSVGTVAYATWSVIMILGLPWLFATNVDEAAVAELPIAVQDLIFEQGDHPILLKCRLSPHIYLLDGTEKRWVKDIETFDSRGYVWRDVHFISCANLRAIPDGVPIPVDAGPPPVP